ncbi:hypothetical protein IMSAGC007_02040 [Lachnospiraceae bacterium]|nr:hypothetical protein IMSAGC007_02040 [Lachnospiraceae bacterium]
MELEILLEEDVQDRLCGTGIETAEPIQRIEGFTNAGFCGRKFFWKRMCRIGSAELE